MALSTIGMLMASSAIGALGTASAANAQKRAAKNELQLNERIYDETVQRFEPFNQAGLNALAAYNYELGLGDKPQGYNGLDLSPGAQFALNEGVSQIEGGAAARGNLFSGATGKALEGYRFELAQTDRDNQLNRLASLASSGQNAAGGQAAAGQNFAIGGSNALANYGNAASAGAIGITNFLNNGLTGYLANQQYNKLLV